MDIHKERIDQKLPNLEHSSSAQQPESNALSEEQQRLDIERFPEPAHARMLIALHHLVCQVRARPQSVWRGVYLVTPALGEPSALLSMLHLPVQQVIARGFKPINPNEFEIRFLDYSAFMRLLEAAEATQPGAIEHAAAVIHLVDLYAPDQEVLVLIAQGGVHLWPQEWLARKVLFILEGIEAGTFNPYG